MISDNDYSRDYIFGYRNDYDYGCSVIMVIYHQYISIILILIVLMILIMMNVKKVRRLLNKTFCSRASMYDRTKVIQILLQAGAGLDVRDGEGLTPFLSAVRAGRLGSAKFLLESGADMRTSDSSSKNCLHVAIEEENLEMVDFLLQRSGLELINMVDKIGRAPLHYAMLSRNSEVALQDL